MRSHILKCSAAFKKKGKAVIEDPFDDFEPLDDLIGQSALSDDVSTSEPTKPSERKKLTPEERLERFDNLFKETVKHLGRKPSVKVPMRLSNWVNLIGLATTEQQLEKISELFPGWKDRGQELKAQTSELFIRKSSHISLFLTLITPVPGRCEELDCPLLALRVFGDYSKYAVKLTLPGARQLLHSLHLEHPIENVMAASALFRVYELPPIASDLTSCSLLTIACLRHNTPESVRIADALIAQLPTLLESHDPSTMRVSRHPRERAKDKSKAWIKWTLKKVDKALYAREGERVQWLSQWRIASGHVPKTSAF